MNAHLAKFIMYFKIHELHRDGHSVSHISEYLVANRRTVKKYLAMSEQEYEVFLIQQSERKKELLPYEAFVKDRLVLFQDTPAAQMHDWLKEHHPDFPKVSPKTVFNFVNWIRGKYNLPKLSLPRQYHPVEELPYGKQAQVDFGEYNLRTSLGKRIKVFFFTMVLSRSRFKYIWFTDQYFTSELAIEAHEKAFDYIQGIPDEIVYDQDKVFIADENKGDIILTDKFRAYVRDKPFVVHFCRKADPESKGKVENVVKYVKQNFLYNRTYYNIETLNDDVMCWMGRTANALPHSFTKKIPFSELALEKPFLKPFQVIVPKIFPINYTVRKDNTISYKSNLYSLPLGTYTGIGSIVGVFKEQDNLIISIENNKEICRHKIASGRGIKILNTDHKRDKSAVINEMIDQICSLFQDHEKARQWVTTIRNDKPRYIRDQILTIKHILQTTKPELVNTALDYCVSNKITSATDFKAIVAKHSQENAKEPDQAKIIPLNPLKGSINRNQIAQPDKSKIEDYQIIFKKQNQ